jgi:predicted nucleic acid-binding protein
MRVVDTSAWLEWIKDTELGRRIGAEIPAPERWLVPTIVQFELVRILTRVMSEEVADEAIASSTRCVIVELDTRLAVSAAECARVHSLAMADAIVYATAVDKGADLLTCDAHFASLPGVVYFAKSLSP